MARWHTMDTSLLKRGSDQILLMQLVVNLPVSFGEINMRLLVATHVDKESHIHNHFLINTVSSLDGKSFIVPKRIIKECVRFPTDSAANMDYR